MDEEEIKTGMRQWTVCHIRNDIKVEEKEILYIQGLKFSLKDH